MLKNTRYEKNEKCVCVCFLTVHPKDIQHCVSSLTSDLCDIRHLQLVRTVNVKLHFPIPLSVQEINPDYVTACLLPSLQKDLLPFIPQLISAKLVFQHIPGRAALTWQIIKDKGGNSKSRWLIPFHSDTLVSAGDT